MRSHHPLARAIVRCYPRAWRARYADEVLTLIDETGFGWWRAADLIVGASREWARTGVATYWTESQWRYAGFSLLLVASLTLIITSLGTAGAVWLAGHVTTPPILSVVDGQTLVAPPALPGWLAFGQAFMMFAVIGRCANAFRLGGAFGWRVLTTPPIDWANDRQLPGSVPLLPRRTIGSHELIAWLVLLLAATMGWQWDYLVNNMGTGLAPRTASAAWNFSVIFVFNPVIWLYFCWGRAVEHARRLHEAAKLRKRQPPKVILGI